MDFLKIFLDFFKITLYKFKVFLYNIIEGRKYRRTRQGGRREMLFKKFFDEILNASTDEEIQDILYRADGVDMMYQKEKLSWQDHERLFKLASRLVDY